MATINRDSYFKYQENRGQSGYRAALLVKKATETHYSLLVASETVPTVFGSADSFEFDLLNSPAKGKIEGKFSLEDKEVEVLHHRDNVYRFMKLEGETLDFLVIDSQFVGYKFKGTISYRMNDASADVLRGTYTITPMSAETKPILNARELCQETLCFSSSIPEEIDKGEEIVLTVAQSDATVTFTVLSIAADGEETDATTATITATTSTEPAKFKATTSGLYAITAAANGYAPWTTTVFVNDKTSTGTTT